MWVGEEELVIQACVLTERVIGSTWLKKLHLRQAWLPWPIFSLQLVLSAACLVILSSVTLTVSFFLCNQCRSSTLCAKFGQAVLLTVTAFFARFLDCEGVVVPYTTVELDCTTSLNRFRSFLDRSFAGIFWASINLIDSFLGLFVGPVPPCEAAERWFVIYACLWWRWSKNLLMSFLWDN